MKYEFRGKNYEVKKVLTKREQDDRVNFLKKGLGKNLSVRDSGMTLYTRTAKDLSRGCKACKDGKWWCVYVGTECNHMCKFCPQEKKENDYDIDPKKFTKLSTKEAVSCLNKFGDKSSHSHS